MTRIRRATGSEIPSQADSDGSLSAPHQGGVGGSALQQALDSESRRAARRTRREARKKEYESYLRSDIWKKIRIFILNRDGRNCRANCGRRATVVHHIRYPRVLGKEHFDWLYSMCVDCHDELHRIVNRRTMTLRHATQFVIERGGGHLNDGTVIEPTPPTKSKTQRKREKKAKKRGGRVQPAHVKADRQKKLTLKQENERLHAIQVANRERRARRVDLSTWANPQSSDPS